MAAPTAVSSTPLALFHEGAVPSARSRPADLASLVVVWGSSSYLMCAYGILLAFQMLIQEEAWRMLFYGLGICLLGFTAGAAALKKSLLLVVAGALNVNFKIVETILQLVGMANAIKYSRQMSQMGRQSGSFDGAGDSLQVIFSAQVGLIALWILCTVAYTATLVTFLLRMSEDCQGRPRR